MRLLKTLLSSLFLISLLSVNASATSYFDVDVKSSGGDYTSWGSAESALDEDLTASDIKVFSFDANSGTISDGTSCSTDGGSTTGTCVHQSIGGQILIKGISGGTFDDNDVVTDGTNTVTLSDGGDDPIVRVTLYVGYTVNGYTSFSGATTDSTNYIILQGDTTDWDGTLANAVTINVTADTDNRFQAMPYFEIAYLGFQGNASAIKCLTAHSSNGFKVHDVIMDQCQLQDYMSDLTIWNFINTNSNDMGIYVQDNWAYVYVYDSTIINATNYGIYDGQATWRNRGVHLYNSVVMGSGTQDIYRSGDTSFEECDYVATGDSSATDCGENTENYIDTGITSADFASLTTGFLTSGSDLIDAGYDYSSTTGSSEDIQGDAFGASRDIGADEYVASAGSTHYPFKQFNHGIMTGVF